jgi:hypothetical protein
MIAFTDENELCGILGYRHYALIGNDTFCTTYKSNPFNYQDSFLLSLMKNINRLAKHDT